MAVVSHFHNEKLSHWRLILDQGGITPEVQSFPYRGAGTKHDPYVVGWIVNDPRSPLLFSRSRKWTITIINSLETLSVAFASSAISGGARQVETQYKIGSEIMALCISLFVLGFAIGPLLWAPIGEMFGRQKPFFISFGAFTALNAACAAAPNVPALIICRFLAGCFGASPLTNAGGVIADMFSASERGLAMAVFTTAPFMGPALGPICGGFLSMEASWRWVEGLSCILSGILWILGIVLVPETYAPVILRQRAKKMSALTGRTYVSVLDVEKEISVKDAFKIALCRPWALLFREPIVLLLSIYMAIIYGTLYMLFAAFPIVYQEGRGWNEGIGGLSFLGIVVGVICAAVYSILDNKRFVKALAGDGTTVPEARLPPSMVGAIALPIGLFWFAWSTFPSVHWIVSILATVPFGFGMVLVALSILTYLIDAYVPFAASALASATVLRSVFGTVFPLFTSYMYRKLGIHWASSVPGFLALIFCPFPFLFYKYGGHIRARCKYAAEAESIVRALKAESGAESGISQ